MKTYRKQIKLQPKHRKLTLGEIKIVPSLHLAGIWLAEHGFKTGNMVTITIEQNKLTITPTL